MQRFMKDYVCELFFTLFTSKLLSKFITTEVLSNLNKTPSGDYTFRFECLQGESYKIFCFSFPNKTAKATIAIKNLRDVEGNGGIVLS